ncbi:MAG: DNA-3-methyladenine glycosylase [Rhizobiaceae bacterium]
MKRIDCDADIDEGLDALCRADPRLVAVRETAGKVPLRRSPPGFESLASIIVSQQVSKASAEAIFERFTGLIDPLTPQAVLGASDEVFRQAGLSRPKQKTLLAVANAVDGDGLDLHDLCDADAGEAMTRLTAVSGIGPWTAEVYLLFAAGHPDIFPARDVALQAAVAEAFGHAARPTERELYAIAESWAPWRGVASRLFWAFYSRMRGREAALGRQIPQSC